LPKNPKRDYAKETAYENSPDQVKRRESRNKVRKQAEKDGKVHKGDGKEVDHLGFHRTGTLANVPTKVVTKKQNRSRQPKRGG
jgi:hypothetical protein